MFCDIITLIFAVAGMIYILLSSVLKILLWRETGFCVFIPLDTQDEKIIRRISNLRSLLEFCGLHKKCTVVVVNYDAPDWFCDKIRNYFGNCKNLKIIKSENVITELQT